MGRRPNNTLPDAPVSIRMSAELEAAIDEAAQKAKMTSTDFMRLCMRIGIEHFKRIDYDTAKCIVESVENQAPKATPDKVIPMYEQGRPKKDKLKVASPRPGVNYEAAAQEHGLEDCHEGQH